LGCKGGGDDKDGTKKYRTEIVADTIQFGPKSGSASSGGSYGSSASSSAPSPKIPQGQTSASGPELDTIEYPEEDINPDDIPF
jgi:single-strand DNA-binding protein